MDQEHAKKAAFEDLYLKERKKAIAFMVSTVVVGILFLGSLAFNAHSRQSPQAGGLFGALHGGGTMGPGGDAGAILQTDISDFFTADGSVDTVKLNELKARVPAQFQGHILSRLEPRIDSAVASGEITSAQATALKKALSGSEG